MKMIGEKGKLLEVNRTIEIKMYDNYFEPQEIIVKKGGSNDLELLFDGRFVRLPKIGSLFSGFTR